MLGRLAGRQRARTLAENLLCLEVNTIIKPEIGAQKMPAPEHALIDIANWYRAELRNHLGTRPTNIAPHTANAVAFDEVGRGAGDRRASAKVFEEIRTVAQCISLSPTASTALSPERVQLLSRIWDNADQLKALFERAGNVQLSRHDGEKPQQIELAPDEIVLVRKIWEIGLEHVVAQTVIQIDGDIFTRIRQDCVGTNALPQILEVHDRAINISVRFWTNLVELLGALAKGALGTFFPGK